MFKIQGRYNGKWEPMFVMRTLMGSLEYVKSAGYDLNEVVDGNWYYIRNESYREPMYESTFGAYSELRIVPITLDFLDNTQEYESVMAQCVTIVSEVIPPNKLRNLLLSKISICEIKDIELTFGEVSKLEFIFDRGEANWIIDEYPEYVDFLLWEGKYETV